MPIVHETWGTASIPEMAGEQLHIDAHLNNVPEEGKIVDIGAGAGLSLAAAVQIRRPDITVVSIDTGFIFAAGNPAFKQDLGLTVQEFAPEQQCLLRQSSRWAQLLVAGAAESIPIADNSVDMVVSYSAIPEYIFDDERVLDELVRIMKIGGTALLGPMHDYVFGSWAPVVEKKLKVGGISTYEAREEDIMTGHGHAVNAYFTEFVK